MRRPLPTFRLAAPPRGDRGFTLIELMIAMVVSGIVVLGIFAFSSIQQHTNAIHERHVRVQRALEGAMWSIARDVQAAGLGWTRYCTELRVWDAENGVLLNPGAYGTLTDIPVDAVTGEPHWVLRDGLQAFWNSAGLTSLQGSAATSASTTSAADAFDVIVAEPNYVDASGIFSLDVADIDAAAGTIMVRTGTNVATTDLDEVQQLFPPGSFVVLARAATSVLAVHPTLQGQCVLLQVTGDLTTPADGQWVIPVGSSSGFNADIASLMADDADAVGPCTSGANSIECDDWVGDGTTATVDWVIPVGRLRWSRYEIDYTISSLPYLVRYDMIGYQPGVDPDLAVGVDYPHCTGTCPAAQLHLFGGNDPPDAVAIGPMIEDMQVAVGCDAYTAANAQAAAYPVPDPDAGYDELTQYSIADGVIDEQGFGFRDVDEWVGNAATEAWAPDCVYWGTGEYRKTDWAAHDTSVTAAYRLSPQQFRVTLMASSEFDEEAGSLGVATIMEVEDRASMTSPVGVRQRFTLTETFAPRNLRWRDPSVY